MRPGFKVCSTVVAALALGVAVGSGCGWDCQAVCRSPISGDTIDGDACQITASSLADAESDCSCGCPLDHPIEDNCDCAPAAWLTGLLPGTE